MGDCAQRPDEQDPQSPDHMSEPPVVNEEFEIRTEYINPERTMDD